MKRLIYLIVFSIVLTLWISNAKSNNRREIAPYCDWAGCRYPDFSLWWVKLSTANQIETYREKSDSTIDSLLFKDPRYVKAELDFKKDSDHNKRDKIYNTILSEFTIDIIAKKLWITNKETTNHLKNITLIDWYYNKINERDYKFASNTTTWSIKKPERYSKTYSWYSLNISSCKFRKEKYLYIYKWNNTYYFPVNVCILKLTNEDTYEGYYSCEVYWVTKQVVSWKLKSIGSKLLWKYKEEYAEWRWDKPIIYFYPEEDTEVNVHLDLKWEFSTTYPQIDNNNNRSIKAKPDWTIINKSDNKEYSYLFREAKKMNPRKIDEWFVVEKENYINFLQEKLKYLWLTPKEYNEFIVYRIPLMNKYPFVSIKFVWEEYTSQAKLTIIPNPDSIQRVFMIFKWLDTPIKIKPQKLKSFVRSGFSIIERWGSEIFSK